MYVMILGFVNNIKINLIKNPATPIYGSLLRTRKRNYSSVLTYEEYKTKLIFLQNIKIYSKGLVKDPVEDYQTLKLFNDLDKYLTEKNKEKAISCIEDFIRNNEGKYNVEYGKAKQQLGDILYSHRKDFKITPIDILTNLGFEKEELINMGIFETTLLKTKTCVSSTVFEVLILDTLPEKYSQIQKVYYCQDGAIKIKCINLTGQVNHDFVIEFKNESGENIRMAFDSKVQKFDTYLKNLKARGLQYQVITLGNISDKEVTQNSAYHQALSEKTKHDKTFFLKAELVKDSNCNLSEYPEDSQVVSTMFINTDDISSNLDRKRLFKVKSEKDNSNLENTFELND